MNDISIDVAIDSKSRKFYSKKYKNKNIDKEAHKDIRFINNNELYYCLKSIQKYLPWINKIYLVTMKPQKPKYLNEFPKVTVVHHNKIFNNNLPTFNSMAIENQLHKIPGLMEHFIYFNDDCLIGRPLSKSFFFTDKGKIIFYGRKKLNRFIKKTYSLIKKKYKIKALTSSPHHLARSLRKSYLNNIWKLFPKELNLTIQNKFRTSNDMWIIGVAYLLSVYSNKAIIKEIKPDDFIYQPMTAYSHPKSRSIINNLKKYKKYPPALLCINDIDSTNNNHKIIFNSYIKIFNEYLSKI